MHSKTMIAINGVPNKLRKSHIAAFRCLLLAITATKAYSPIYKPMTNKKPNINKAIIHPAL